MISTNYHNPVLLAESVDGLNIIEDGIYVDATYGGGGHSREILSRLGEKGQLIAFDQDFDSKANLIDDNRLLFINENFMYLKNFLKLNTSGRLLIPRDLIDFADISKEIVVSSSVDIIEIWDKNAYEETIKDATVDFASLAEEVMGQDDD